MMEKRQILGHKPMKDRIILLLCVNVSSNGKVKPVLVYHFQIQHAFSGHNVNKAKVTYHAKGQCEGLLHKASIHAMATQGGSKLTTKKCLCDHQSPERSLLLIDNAAGQLQPW